MFKAHIVGSALVLLLSSCASVNDTEQVRVEVRHLDEGGDKIVEVRGIAADGAELGRLLRRTGTIADLPAYAPGTNTGSEIAITVGGVDHRIVTREQEMFVLFGGMATPDVDRFLAIDEVSAALREEAHILVALPSSSPADATETAFSTRTCPTSAVLTYPVAQQCCQTYNYPNNDGTVSMNDASLIVTRAKNPTGIGCRAFDGSTCAGANCWYGPNAHARAAFYGLPPGYTYQRVVSANGAGGNNICVRELRNSFAAPKFPNVTGTFPTGCGCCGNGTGTCNTQVAGSQCTAYGNCSACVGGGASSVSPDWDY